MNRLLPFAGALVALALPSAAAAQGSAAAGPPAATVHAAQADTARAPHDAQKIVVRYKASASLAARAAAQRDAGAGSPRSFAPYTRTLRVRPGQSVAGALARLRSRSDVAYAVPDYVAKASYVPNDPGPPNTLGGWQSTQWNFLADTGVNAPVAWDHLIAAKRPGAKGVTIAVLDTGVAYSDRGRFKRSPDFAAGRFVQGYDFVGRDGFPNDENGHGTHVAGTIGESTNNGVALAGLAYGARIMPVRVLNSRGEGDASDIAAGIRYAARHGAQVINLSLEFSAGVRQREIPGIIEAIRYAEKKNVVVVGASGNEADSAIAYPARYSPVISVGATTEHLCVADYANVGSGLDLVAPGGGGDAENGGAASCRPDIKPLGRDIFQLTLNGSVRRFGYPDGYEGTSMAAPHVAATAALIIASGVLGSSPTPDQIEERLKSTARDLGPPGYDRRYGYGLIDAAKATDPTVGPVIAPPQ
ncbi:MAG TPA: S8 family serine peptidase [Solirubrobacteraceae bacterium]|nr:S8 family serine peptidase [Solirubrobacteraceae bacterium]